MRYPNPVLMCALGVSFLVHVGCSSSDSSSTSSGPSSDTVTDPTADVLLDDDATVALDANELHDVTDQDAELWSDVGEFDVGDGTDSTLPDVTEADDADSGYLDQDCCSSDTETSSDLGLADTSLEDIGPDDGDATDAGAVDAGASDAGPEDTGAPDIGPPPAACTATVVVDAPMADDFFVVGQGVSVEATVTDPAGGALTGFQVEWLSSTGSVLGTSAVDAAGATTAVLTGITKGKQDLRARVIDANGPCEQETLHPIFACTANVVEDFNSNLTSPWVIFGDASWNSAGYIEMTGAAQGKKGAVYNDAEYVSPGSVSIRFDVQTGGGSGSGADGFAMTIVETDDTADLPVILGAAKSGGGLAYASQGGYGAPVTFKAFTVEIDTWYNQFNGGNEFHTDPTADDHVELTLDLDAGNSIAFTSAGEIEDLAWHTLRVDVVGTQVKVWLDGDLKVDQDVPELDFRGGYIFFSGSTGYYTNFHRFENLEIIHNCKSGTP